MGKVVAPLIVFFILSCSKDEVIEPLQRTCDTELYQEDGVWWRCLDWEIQNGNKYCMRRVTANPDHPRFNPCN